MKVLKFGGSSVASSENIQKVLAIVKEESKNQKIAVVVSAFGKTTNALIEGANLAAHKNEDYKDILKKLEEHHLNVVKDLIPVKNQKTVTSYIQQLLTNLETIYKGCYLLQELTPKTLAKISPLAKKIIPRKIQNIIVKKIFFPTVQVCFEYQLEKSTVDKRQIANNTTVVTNP